MSFLGWTCTCGFTSSKWSEYQHHEHIVHYATHYEGMSECSDETTGKTVTDLPELVTCPECEDIARSYNIY